MTPIKRRARGGTGPFHGPRVFLWLCALPLATAASADQPPIIQDIRLTNARVLPGQTVGVICEAEDPDGGALTYLWQTEDGSLSEASDLDERVEWTVPDSEGNFMITVQVVDSTGMTSKAERLAPVGPIGSLRQIRGPVHQPARLALDAEGNLWVTDASRAQVVRFDQEGDHTGGFSTAPAPLGLAVTDTEILVGEDSLNRVARYGHSGNLMGVIAPGEIRMPSAVCINPSTEQILIVDSLEAVVRVHSSDGTFGWQVGGPGTLDFPVDVALDVTQGEMYVADQGASQIVVFDTDGNFLRRLGSRGHRPGQFLRLQAIALDGEEGLLALDALLGNIQLLSRDGSHLATFGQVGDWMGSTRNPLGLAAQPGALVFAAPGGRSTVEVFIHWAWVPDWAGQALMVF